MIPHRVTYLNEFLRQGWGMDMVCSLKAPGWRLSPQSNDTEKGVEPLLGEVIKRCVFEEHHPWKD